MVKKVIRFIVLIIGLSLVAYSGYHLFKIYSDYNTSDKTYEKLQDEYAVDDSKKMMTARKAVKHSHRGMMI